MIGIVIPTLNAAKMLPGTVAALANQPIWIADGGSTDDTAKVVDQLGCHLVASERGRGIQIKTGCEAALSDPSIQWLLVLHADTRLEDGWRDEVARHCAAHVDGTVAACFTLKFDDDSPKARAVERWVARRVKLFGLAYGDQGLLIHRDLYRMIGGYQPLPLMEDVDLVRRIGKHRLVMLDTPAVTSAVRYIKEGFRRRGLRNLCLLSLYFLGVPPRVLAKLY